MLTLRGFIVPEATPSTTQSMNLAPARGVAVTCTTALAGYGPGHGFADTVPLPDDSNDSACVARGSVANCAVTVRFAAIVTEMGLSAPTDVPLALPVARTSHPLRYSPAAGVAVTVTTVPPAKVGPPGDAATVPDPCVASVNVRDTAGFTTAHTGCTVWAWSITSAKGLVGERATPSTFHAMSFTLVPEGWPVSVTAVPAA
jgi:hypothetical protein